MTPTEAPTQQIPTTPEKVMQIALGGWASAILGAGVHHSIFTHLEGGPRACAWVAEKAGISHRGAQALLDGLAGVGLLDVHDGMYENSPTASSFLVRDKPAYLGGFVEINTKGQGQWEDLAQIARTGSPGTNAGEIEDNPFWEELVPALAPLAAPVAQQAGDHLGIPRAGEFRMLDIGGGSGMYSAVWLAMNPKGRATQLDWPNVNGIARRLVSRFAPGVADRFETSDGDFHAADLGQSRYDYVILSNICHQETPDSVLALLRRIRKALKPGGTLVISDFVLEDDRTGTPMAMMFSARMLLSTEGGAAYRKADYREWLKQTGFEKGEFERTSGPASIHYAS